MVWCPNHVCGNTEFLIYGEVFLVIAIISGLAGAMLLCVQLANSLVPSFGAQFMNTINAETVAINVTFCLMLLLAIPLPIFYIGNILILYYRHNKNFNIILLPIICQFMSCIIRLYPVIISVLLAVFSLVSILLCSDIFGTHLNFFAEFRQFACQFGGHSID